MPFDPTGPTGDGIVPDPASGLPVRPVPVPPAASRDRQAAFVTPSRTAALDAVVAAVRDGEAVTVLTGGRGAGKTTLLDAAAARLAPAVHFLRLGNPLSGPLTLDRLLIQFGSGEQEASDAGQLVAVFRALRDRVSGESRVVVTVEEAETLAPQALLFLGMLPTLSAAGLPGFQLLLVGRPELHALLEQDGFRELRGRIGRQVALEPPGVPASAPPRAPDGAPRWLRRGRVGVPAVLALLACAVVAAVVLTGVLTGRFRGGPSGRVASLPVSLPAEAPAAPTSSSPPGQEGEASGQGIGPAQDQSAALPSEPVAPVEDARTARRREFEAFLDRQAGAPASLSPAQREALFQEYLAWRERLVQTPPDSALGSPPDQAASTTGR